MTRSATAAAGVFLTSCFGDGLSTAPRPRPTYGRRPEAIDTRWPIKRVVYLNLENRSFDHMFGKFPGANGATTGVRDGREVPLRKAPEWLPGDLPHDLWAYMQNYRDGRMDGFAQGEHGAYFAYTQFDEEDIPAYWKWAREYVLCDNFFASVAGPSFANHLYYVAGDGGGAIDNPENIRTRKLNDGRVFKSWGCDAYGEDVYVLVRDEVGNVTKHDTCFNFRTMGEELSERDIDWAYYSAAPYQAGYIWNAYSAFEQVFGTELWDEHIWPVDDVIRDCQAGALPSMTWITPRFQLSDHPPFSTKHAHNWVVDIVNAIMEGPMWESIAIFLTWDEWGGLYDHVEPPKIDHMDLGFRVPTLVISPYARRGYIDDALAEFSSPLRFVADNWDLPYIAPRIRTSHNYEHVFDFDRKPRPPVPGRKVPATSTFHDFPEDYEGWPEGVQPTVPTVRYP